MPSIDQSIFAAVHAHIKLVIDCAENRGLDKQQAAKELLEHRHHAFALFQLCSKKAKEYQQQG